MQGWHGCLHGVGHLTQKIIGIVCLHLYTAWHMKHAAAWKCQAGKRALQLFRSRSTRPSGLHFVQGFRSNRGCCAAAVCLVEVDGRCLRSIGRCCGLVSDTLGRRLLADGTVDPCIQ